MTVAHRGASGADACALAVMLMAAAGACSISALLPLPPARLRRCHALVHAVLRLCLNRQQRSLLWGLQPLSKHACWRIPKPPACPDGTGSACDSQCITAEEALACTGMGEAVTMAWRGRLRTPCVPELVGEEVFDAGQVGQAQQGRCSSGAAPGQGADTPVQAAHPHCLMSMPEVRDLLHLPVSQPTLATTSPLRQASSQSHGDFPDCLGDPP